MQGVYRLLFNFFLVRLGYDNSLVGNLTTASSLTALCAAIPMGYLVDRMGHKPALIWGSLGMALAVCGMVFFPSTAVLVAMTVLIGLSNSLAGVTMGPFLMENSSEKERVYLFSFSQGLQMASGFIGSSLGGMLPTWLSGALGVNPTDSLAYGAALLAIAAGIGAGAVPLFFLRSLRLPQAERSLFAPFSYLVSRRGEIIRPILPLLVTAIGAGLFMPFMNLFFRQVHHQPDPLIGTLFAASSLTMGIGTLIAPVLAERIGKIQVVVITQALSIPFLVMLGFSPWFAPAAIAYLMRAGLMNMSSPVYQTYVMERVEPKARATAASLMSMAHNFGWAISPTVSGWLQVKYGFSPVFLLVILLYMVSIVLYWVFFWRRPRRFTSIAIEGNIKG